MSPLEEQQKEEREKVESCKMNSTKPHSASVHRQSFTSIELFSKMVYKCNDDECTEFISQHVLRYKSNNTKICSFCKHFSTFLRLFYIRMGRSKTGKGRSKTGKGRSKTGKRCLKL